MSDRRAGGARPARVSLVAVHGRPTSDERRALEIALDELVARERASVEASLWKRAGRAQGRRLGMYDYRDRFSSEDAWRLSVRFPPGGREYPGLVGRGDAR